MDISVPALRTGYSAITIESGYGSGMADRQCDVAIIGAGIVGLAVGLQLVRKNPGLKVIILDKETEVASH